MKDNILQILAILIGGGGMIGGLVALFKVRPEAARISVDAAQGAVVVQASVITSLREENDKLRQHCGEIEEENEELRHMLNAIDDRKKKERR